MTAITNQTAPTSWTTWFRRTAISIANLAAGARGAAANTSDLERDMRRYAVEAERQQRVIRLSAGNYSGMID
jgi:hypothetical protein